MLLAAWARQLPEVGMRKGTFGWRGLGSVGWAHGFLPTGRRGAPGVEKGGGDAFFRPLEDSQRGLLAGMGNPLEVAEGLDIVYTTAFPLGRGARRGSTARCWPTPWNSTARAFGGPWRRGRRLLERFNPEEYVFGIFLFYKDLITGQERLSLRVRREGSAGSTSWPTSVGPRSSA